MANVTFAVIQWDGTFRQAEATGDVLATLQSAVGGYVEPLRLASDLIAMVNEDGYALNLDPNPVASDVLRALGSQHYFGPAGAVLGSVVFVGSNGSQEVSLRPKQIDMLRTLHELASREED